MLFKEKESKNFSVSIIRFNGFSLFFYFRFFYSIDVKKIKISIEKEVTLAWGESSTN